MAFHDFTKGNIRTALIRWLLGGGVSDGDWDAFQKDLNGKVNLESIQKVYQDAYDRFTKG